MRGKGCGGSSGDGGERWFSAVVVVVVDGSIGCDGTVVVVDVGYGCGGSERWF